MEQDQSIAQALGLIPTEEADSGAGPPLDARRAAADAEAAGSPPATKADWDSPDNPYKAEAEKLKAASGASGGASEVQQFLQQRNTAIEQEGRLALSELMATQVQGGQMTVEAAQLLVATLQSAARTQAQAEADRMLLRPTAVRATADQIAAQYSTPTVKITAEDLMDQPTPEAMKAAAMMIQRYKRDEQVSARARNGTDTVEGGGSFGSIDPKTIAGLSPTSMIKLGLIRGQR